MSNTVETNAQPVKAEARIGDVYEDTVGMILDGKPGYMKGVRWTLVGLGCDGMFVGESNGMRIRMVSYNGRFKRVEKGTGDKVQGWWEFHKGNYSMPLVCSHGQQVQDGLTTPKAHCMGCAVHLRLKAEAERKSASNFREEARLLWKTCYS